MATTFNVTTLPAAVPFTAVEAAWRAVEARATNSFFLSETWIGAWLTAVAPPARLFVVSLDGSPMGAALVVRAPRSIRNPLRTQYRLHETGVPQIDGLYIEYNGILADQSCAPDAFAAILSELQRESTTARRWVFPTEVIVSSAAPEFAAMVQARFPNARVKRRDRSPFIDLARLRKEGVAHLSSLSANARQQLRRARRNFEVFGALRLERAETIERAHEYLTALKPLHIARWRALGKPSGFDNPAFEPMLNALIARGVGSGSVDVLRLSAGERRLGYLINFSYRSDVLNYASGFDYDTDRRLKPGLVSHLLAIEDADAKGARSYKFLAGGVRYKESLSTDSEELVGLSVRL